MDNLIAQFKQVYERLNKDTTDSLNTIYSDNLQFIDPFHELNGLDEFKKYCKKLYANVSHCKFDFQTSITEGNQGFINWEMTIEHPKLNKGKRFIVPGVTHFKFNEKIYYHRDYFDGGKLLYENIPLVGGVIRSIKKRM